LGYGNKVGRFDHAAFALVALLWLLLGGTVFLQRRASLAAHFFLLSSAAGSSYLGVGTLSGVSVPDALLYTSGLLLFPPLTLGFVRALDGDHPWRLRELVSVVPAVALAWPMAQDFVHGHKSMAYRMGVASVGIYLLVATVQAARGLWRARAPEAAAQMRALLVGLLAGSLPGIALFVVPLAVWGRLLLVTTWQPLLVLFFLIGMSYAALLFEFSEADLIVRRGVVYGAMTLAIVVAYAALGELLAANRLSVVSPAGGTGFVVVAVLVGAAFGPVRRLAHRFVDWLLYGGSTDRWDLLEALSANLATVMQPPDLGRILVRELRGALHLRGAFLLLRDRDGSYRPRYVAVAESDHGRAPAIPDDLSLGARAVEEAFGCPPRPLLLVHGRPLLPKDRGATPMPYRPLDDLGVALAAPLTTRSGLQAVLCLQRKVRHDDFDARDLALLAPLLRQASAALDNALLFARLGETVAELRRAYVRLAHEQEAERARLAGELHDGTAQELAAMITLTSVLGRQMEGENAPARRTLNRLSRQAEDSYEGLRRASHALRPMILDGRGLIPALRRYLDEFERTTHIAVEVSAADVGALADEMELALFRVAQECMENVRKHSGSRTARLTLRRDDRHISLSVSDAGRGMQAGDQGGIGMVGMRERLAAVGGTLQVESVPGAGARIEAIVPIGE
ncbi:MAG: GAF domain-containing sensor histidine kinase, partial [Chloroflexi bacterium]|nr:GAF domain-containing sensor histidine kinase [Chloroflexota bacterium]